MARRFPLPFSPLYDFVATRSFTLNGVELKAGDPIDKSGLSNRRLEQLYTQRQIKPVPPDQVPADDAPVLDAPAAAENPAAGEGEAPPAPDAQPPADTTTSEAPPAPAAADQPPAGPVEQSTPPAPPAGNPVALTGTPVSMRHAGFGRYFLTDAEGKDVSGQLTKVQAQELLADHTKAEG